MELMTLIKKRYSTKLFDENKHLTSAEITQLEELLQYSPSSTNAQPWHFIIATTDEGKERIAKGTEGAYVFNKEKILNASAVVVFASKVSITDDYLHHVLDKEDIDGRFENPDAKIGQHAGRSRFVNMHRYDKKDFQHWADKQNYLNAGYFMLGTAMMGLDSIPMEGVDFQAIDEEFGLREKGFTSTLVISVGYRHDDDFNAKLPKSRLDKEEIFTRV